MMTVRQAITNVILLAVALAATWVVVLIFTSVTVEHPAPQPTPSPGLGQSVISGDWDGRRIVCIVWRQRDGSIGSDCWDAGTAGGER